MSRSRLVRLALPLLLLLSTAIASAQPPPAAPRPAPQVRYDFDEDLVEGALARGDGDVVSGRLAVVFPSLIQRRLDFLPELRRSAEAH